MSFLLHGRRLIKCYGGRVILSSEHDDAENERDQQPASKSITNASKSSPVTKPSPS